MSREKIGRNDPCPCKSGKKYKKCHGRQDPPSFFDSPAQAKVPSLHERNLILLGAVADIFRLTKGEDIWEIKRNISDAQVRAIYQVVADIWPPFTDLNGLLPFPDRSLRALYMGDINPEQIVRNVFRFSLYTDQILVIDPFHNPWGMAEEFNPLVNPGQWKADTLKLIFFTMLLAPWIEAGLVTIVPDPGNFDFPLRKKTWDLASERLKGWTPGEEDTPDYEPAAKADFARFISMLPKEHLAHKVREVHPGIPEHEVAEVLKYMERVRQEDPLALEQPIEQAGSQMTALRTGVNLEMGMYLAQVTGAFPYTNFRSRWKEILSVTDRLPDTAQVWSPLTRAFQEQHFKFLDNVDSGFACALRKDGRLEGFRAFLRRMWIEVGGNPDPSKAETLARDFGDELTDEYHKAEAEWNEIDRSLLKQFGATVAGGIVTGAFVPHISAAGIAIAGVLELVNARMKRGEFRKKVPMSVFIDLSKNQKH
jgi:hypothetical protein